LKSQRKGIIADLARKNDDETALPPLVSKETERNYKVKLAKSKQMSPDAYISEKY